MSVQIMVPALGESVSEATVLKWFKNVGEAVEVDEPLVELETDKVTVEVPAPAAGVLMAIDATGGAEVAVGAILGSLEEGGTASAAPAAPAVSREGAAPAAEPAPHPNLSLSLRPPLQTRNSHRLSVNWSTTTTWMHPRSPQPARKVN